MTQQAVARSRGSPYREVSVRGLVERLIRKTNRYPARPAFGYTFNPTRVGAHHGSKGQSRAT
jgi:hypothetical protein